MLCQHLNREITRSFIGTEENLKSEMIKYTCLDCGLFWQQPCITNSNITTEKFLRHFREVEHSENSPFIKVWEEPDGLFGGTKIDFKECKICKMFLNQKHYW